MRLALRLARRAYGRTSPNPLVGAVLVRQNRVIGQGYHHRAGDPHAEIEAIRDAERRGRSPRGTTLYVTLEPCSTHGRTPPCTEAIRSSGIRRLVAGTADPNPAHAGRGFQLLRAAGLEVDTGVLHTECSELNDSFNHWIVRRQPLVTVKAAMTLDGRIATASGMSKWITGSKARAYAMNLRQGADAILVGVNTVIADDPSLTVRTRRSRGCEQITKVLRRIILDSHARTPITANVISDEFHAATTVVVTAAAPARRVRTLAKRVTVLLAPSRQGRIDLGWLLRRLGRQQITSLLVEGGGEVNAAFLQSGLAHRVAFFYAPLILGGQHAIRAVGGEGAKNAAGCLSLRDMHWRQIGPDLLLTARMAP